MATKDTYYFSHDYNTRSNKKIKALIEKHGATGYGIYWALNEDLYNNSNLLPLDLIKVIAREMRTKYQKVESVLKDFGLYQIKDGSFWSEAVAERLKERSEKSAKASKSANNRWKGDANALHDESNRNALKERKGEERKGEEIIIKKPEKKFSIGITDILEPVSVYFKNNQKIFYEQFLMKNGSDIFPAVLAELDVKYTGYTFTDENHLNNSFRTTYKEIREGSKKNTPVVKTNVYPGSFYSTKPGT